MIFKSDKYRTTWDTWVYYHEGMFYLYYLITEFSPGEGFGVATSDDGVNWTDHGKQISASEDMRVYLGTGSVWRSLNADNKFICNYSEWRESAAGNYQNIFFAVSDDLIHWKKLPDDTMFGIDGENYKTFELEGGRWDCIFPLKKPDGYYGYFTALPKDYLGCGLAESHDGISWKALPPPRFLLEEKGVREGVEAGAVCQNGGRYYSIAGTYCDEYGMAVLVSDSPFGEFKPQVKNFALLSNRSFMHAYFMRLFDMDGELMLNHHSCLRGTTEYNRLVTYAAPFKKVIFDSEGTLRLKWWAGNEKLKGEPVGVISGGGVFAEGYTDGRIVLRTEDGVIVITITGDGHAVYTDADGRVLEDCAKDMQFKDMRFRLLVFKTMTELYIDDYFITCYTLTSSLIEICGQEVSGLKLWNFLDFAEREI